MISMQTHTSASNFCFLLVVILQQYLIWYCTRVVFPTGSNLLTILASTRVV